jgi:hypothetical protein
MAASRPAVMNRGGSRVQACAETTTRISTMIRKERYGRGGHDDKALQPKGMVDFSGLPGKGDRGGRTGNQSSQNTAEASPGPGSQPLIGKVARHADSHNQYHHEPGFIQADHVFRPKGFFGQNGQHDQRDSDKYHDGLKIFFFQAGDLFGEKGFEVK